MTLVFVLLIVFQLKHFIADYPLQAFPFFLGKFRADWKFFWPLLAHAAIHGAMSGLICLIFGLPLVSAILAALFDVGVHFSMDRIKAAPDFMGRWKPLTAADYMNVTATLQANPPTSKWRTSSEPGDKAKRLLRGNTLFWICLGFDQMIHHLTHYAIIWYILQGG